MGKKLYVGNLPYSATDSTLNQLFAQVGAVASAQVIMDRDSGRSKGFGFVEMTSEADATAAIQKFNGQDLDGRALTVNEAKPQAPRENRGGFGGGRNRY
jgi:RNA recognition motif-containing protein